MQVFLCVCLSPLMVSTWKTARGMTGAVGEGRPGTSASLLLGSVFQIASSKKQTHTNPRTQTHTASLSPADGQWVASLILLQKDQIIGHLNWTLKTLISKMPLFVSNTVPAEAVHVLSITNQFHIYPRSTRGLLYCAVILLLLKLHHSGNQLPKGDPWD